MSECGNADTVVELDWASGQRFEARSAGHTMTVDGDGEAGASPMQHLAIALAGCMGIDIAHVLEKMRTPPTRLAVHLEGDRAADPPRRFTAIRLLLEVEGDVPRPNLDRAVTLSRERYCSVWHSLAPDIRFEIDASISPPPDA